MSDAAGGPDTPDIAEAVVQPKRKRGLQLVWIIPLVAALIGGWLAVKTLLERGPTITISFKTGEGLEAGKTKIKYKDVDIGLVKTVALADDRSLVVATAELSKQAEGFLLDDTRFWVVRPRVSGSSVSGLGTLLGGSYIGVDVGKADQSRRAFTGLEAAPVVTLDVPGRYFDLRAEDLGSLDVGSPIYFRRVQAGQVVAYELDKDGAGVSLKIFVYAPYDQFVSANTRFWNASGVDVNLDATGLKVDTQSLTSILVGGIAFQTPANGAGAVRAEENADFKLYADRELALKNPDLVADDYLLVFRSSVRGLSVGAPVDFGGIVVGDVTAIGIEFDPVTKVFVSPVEIRLYPERLRERMRKGSPDPKKLIADTHKRIDALVANGLRAQLRSGNLLTGQLYVSLDFLPDAAKAKMDWSSTPPQVPTVSGGLDELQASVAKIAKELEKVQFDAIGSDLRKTLQTLDRTLHSTDQLVKRIDQDLTPELQSAINSARRALDAADRTLGSNAPLNQGAQETLRDVSRAANSLRALTDYLERHPDALIRGKKEDLP
jgi:paraquat-inducible protein B